MTTKDSILAKDQSDRKTQEIGEIIRESYVFNKRDLEFSGGGTEKELNIKTNYFNKNHEIYTFRCEGKKFTGQKQGEEKKVYLDDLKDCSFTGLDKAGNEIPMNDSKHLSAVKLHFNFQLSDARSKDFTMKRSFFQNN